jgi:epoxyqueuosine reductase
MLPKTTAELANAAQLIQKEIKSFTRNSPQNYLPEMTDFSIYDEPIVQFADGDDPIFTQYKEIVGPLHLAPREALAEAFNRNLDDALQHISVISWVLPITSKIRKSKGQQKQIPSRLWALAHAYGKKFKNALHEHMVEFLTEMGYMAVAPKLQRYYKVIGDYNDVGCYANWSEKHVAYAAGLGTFSLSGNLITERGTACDFGNIVTNMFLPASPRLASTPFSNCLFYFDGSCKACITCCPSGAITDEGYDSTKCAHHTHEDLAYLWQEYGIERVVCGLCQAKTPCAFRNPTNTKRKGKTPNANI